MPYFDETGPMGNGPMTGRGLGPCGGGYGRGRGRGRGFGRGFGRAFGFGRGWDWPWIDYDYYQPTYQQPTKQQETDMLKNYIRDLEEELKAVKKEIQNLQSDK